MIYEMRCTTGTGMPATQNGVANAGSSVTVPNALLYLTGGKLALVATDGTAVVGVGLNLAVNADDPVTFLPFLDGVEILIETANAVTQADIGVPYAITVTSGDAVLDDSDTGHDLFFITAIDPDNSKKAWVKPLSTCNQNLIGG